MEDNELKILEFMKSEEYIPMRAKEIAMLMRVPKKEYNDFLEALGKLELNFKIENIRKELRLIEDIEYRIPNIKENLEEKNKEEKSRQEYVNCITEAEKYLTELPRRR